MTLAEFVERFPHERAKPLRVEPPAPAAAPAPTVAHPPETAAAAPPEAPSMEHRDQDQIEPSSWEATAPETDATIAVTQQEQVEVTNEDQEIARSALAERMTRKHPARSAPRWFEARELAMVAACAAALEGDARSKMQAQRDANRPT